ncbi:MAG: hypothetical protein LC713_01790 [Actinobacteria bacterium]|nr:hypothetical protein [Actinomycetota bacterium]
MSRRGRTATLALILVLALGVSACGSSSSTSSNGTATTEHVSLPKTKFLLHSGLAFGAFHHFIYKPYKAGKLTGGGLFSHKVNLVKAGLAGLFAYHEIKLALVDAQSSPLLMKLLSPLTALSDKLKSLGTALKGGSVDGAAVEATNSQAAVTSSASQAAGAAIKDAIPSASQLAGG